MTIDEAQGLEELRGLLQTRALQNTHRLLIMIALYLSGRLTFTELARVTGVPRGSLTHHIQVLEQEGLIKKQWYPTLLGPRQYIRITDKGKNTVEELLRTLQQLQRQPKPRG